jgi:electron transfer flavoprotein beta subunit
VLKIVVGMRQLADLVEELEVADSGVDIDRDFVKFVSNEWDEAALEEALLIKEQVGGEVVVVALDEPDVDQTLYSAIAKGADRAVKIVGVEEGWTPTRLRAQLLAKYLESEGDWDAFFTGVQAADDLDGQLAGLIGASLGVAHAAVVSKAEPEGPALRITQELGGGTLAESVAEGKVVLGVQAGRQAPRYAPITRIRQAMSSTTIESFEAPEVELGPGPKVRKLYPPESKGQATMLEGDPVEVAEKIVEIIRTKGLVR